MTRPMRLWTLDEDALLRKLVGAGSDDATIGATIGRSVAANVNLRRQALGQTRRLTGPFTPADDLLIRQTVSPEDMDRLATNLGRNTKTIHDRRLKLYLIDVLTADARAAEQSDGSGADE